MLNSASRHRPSKSMELRRAASGLVKVICRTEESRPGGRGKKPGKPKQKGLLASFEEWFGSINMMNILYVWFPASWGPSVVEAIQTRNVTCLAKKPIVRDPHIFDRKEAARGSRAREVTCRIQKWNIFFFYCIAELAIKPCRSSRSNMRGEFGIPKHLQNRKQKHDKATTTPKPQTPTTTNKDTASVWKVRREVKKCETSEAAQRTHM